jgi:hypothetical protein
VPCRWTLGGKEQGIMSAVSDLDARFGELAERYYHSLEDQLYDPDPEVDGYDKPRQRQHILELLQDLAQEAIALAQAAKAQDL